LSAGSAFRSLASILREPEGFVEPAPDDAPPIERDANASSALEAECDLVEIVREMRLFRARLNELLAQSLQSLCADIATDVLARELQIAPADVAAIAERLAARFLDEHPVRVRVHPDEVDLVNCGLPVTGDGRLHRGDAVLELRGGVVDASLGVRLQGVLDACT